MIIDFHTHMFPDKIAARTIDFLSKTDGDMNPFTDGTWKGLKESTNRQVLIILSCFRLQPDQVSSYNQ